MAPYIRAQHYCGISQYWHLSWIQINPSGGKGGPFAFLNEQLTRTGAVVVLCMAEAGESSGQQLGKQ